MSKLLCLNKWIITNLQKPKKISCKLKNRFCKFIKNVAQFPSLCLWYYKFWRFWDVLFKQSRYFVRKKTCWARLRENVIKGNDPYLYIWSWRKQHRAEKDCFCQISRSVYVFSFIINLYSSANNVLTLF